MPATGFPHWFFRTADFVRLQSMVIQLLLGLLMLFSSPSSIVLHGGLSLFLFLSFLYQLAKVHPYSILYPKDKTKLESEDCISIFAANVLQTNTKYNALLKELKAFDADIVLLMETNQRWEAAISEIEQTHPFSIKIPQDNFYGMHLYSKKELTDVETLFQIERDVPSIFSKIRMGLHTIQFVCLHPAPPSPTENKTSIERDAELLLSAKKIQKSKLPTVICGDMNDVVWSRVTRTLKKMTGMVDPRVGRGFFLTYHASYWFMRFPLDHLFHSPDLFVKTMKRSAYFGSDHFGMYYELHLKTKPTRGPSQPKKYDEKLKDKILKQVT